jgi:hypothetical protein
MSRYFKLIVSRRNREYPIDFIFISYVYFKDSKYFDFNYFFISKINNEVRS